MTKKKARLRLLRAFRKAGFSHQTAVQLLRLKRRAVKDGSCPSYCIGDSTMSAELSVDFVNVCKCDPCTPPLDAVYLLCGDRHEYTYATEETICRIEDGEKIVEVPFYSEEWYLDE